MFPSLQPDGNVFTSVCPMIYIRIFSNYLHGDKFLSPWRKIFISMEIIQLHTDINDIRYGCKYVSVRI